METIIDFDWTKQPQFEPAFFAPQQYVTIDSGRGTGKTIGGFNWLLEELITIPELRSGLWVDTVQSNIDKYVVRYLQHMILKNVWDRVHYDMQRKVLSLWNGKYIDFVSAEKPQNMEGSRYHRTVLNESGIILKNPKLWDNSIEPMTHPRDGIANKTRLIGTMKGKNKFHQLTRQNNSRWRSYHFTVYDSPLYTAAELEAIKASVPEEVWRQEYLSEALDDAGSVFRSIGSCVYDPDLYWVNKGVPGTLYGMSIDLAKHQDFTVIVVAELKTKRVVYMERFNQVDWVFQKKRIYDVWLRFNKPQTIIDSTGVGDAIYDDLAMAGMRLTPFRFSNASKNELIQNLSVAMDNRKIEFPRFRELINELEIFEYTVSGTGVLRYNAPSGFHDDCVISLALVNHLLNQHRPATISFI